MSDQEVSSLEERTPQKMVHGAQIELARHLLSEQGIDTSTVDLQAEIDPSLHFDENWKVLKDKFGIKTDADLDKEIEKYEQIIRERRARQFREMYEQSLEQVREQGKAVADYYANMREFVRAVVESDQNSLIVFSRAGLGKSYQILSVLKEMGLERGKDYALLNSYTTALDLYHFLYQHRDKIVVLDDVEGIVQDRRALSILRATTWSVGDKRMVNYHSTTSKLEAPKQFEFEGTVIMTLNRKADIPEMEALISRSIFYQLEIPYEELVGGLLPTIGENLRGKDGVKVAEYIGEKTDPSSNIDIRTLMKAINLYDYAENDGVDWKPLVDELLDYDEELQLVWELMQSGKSVSEQVKEFRQKTGRSRRTYYRRKKQLKKRTKTKVWGV